MSLVLNVEILGEFKKLTQATTGAQKSLSGLEKGVKGISSKIGGTLAAIGVGFSLSAVIKGINETVEAASDLQQQFGAIDSVFKNFAPNMKAFAETLAPIGISSADAAREMTVLGAQLKGFGLSTGTAAVKTQELIVLAADLAATFGGTTSEAVSALGSLFRGEFDPVEKYGVAIKKSDINARLAAEGLSGLTGESLKQAEAQAALALLFEKTADAQGQAARESESYASQQAYLRAESDNLKAQLGEALMPVMIELFQAIRDSLPEIKELIAQFIEFLPAIIGVLVKMVEMKDTLIPLTLALTGMAAAIRLGTAAYGAYKLVAGGIAALNAGIAASNTAVAASAGTATAAVTALTAAFRIALAIGAIGGVLSLGGSAPLPGTVPSTTNKGNGPDKKGMTVPTIPNQKTPGIPGFTAPVTINVNKGNVTAEEIVKVINQKQLETGSKLLIR
jgi:hypothetical protein